MGEQPLGKGVVAWDRLLGSCIGTASSTSSTAATATATPPGGSRRWELEEARQL